MTQSAAISAAIEAAKAQANTVAPSPAPVPATVASGAGLTVPPAARPRSLADAMASAGAAVNKWIGVNEYGIYVDKDKKNLLSKLAVTVNLRDVKWGYGVRYSVGSQVQYGKSFDGVRAVGSGRPWAELVAEAQRMDPKCRGHYDLAEIPMKLLEPIKKGKDIVLDVGKTIGFTTSVMNFKSFMAFVQVVVAKYGEEADIPTLLTAIEEQGPTGPYGQIGFSELTQ